MSSDKKPLKKPKIPAYFKTLDGTTSTKILGKPTFSLYSLVPPKRNNNTIKSIVNKAKAKKEARQAKKKLSDSNKRPESLNSQMSKNEVLTSPHKKSKECTTDPTELDRKNTLEIQIKKEEKKYKELEKKYKVLLAKYSKSEDEYKKQIEDIYKSKRIFENYENNEETEYFTYQAMTLNEHVGHLKEILRLSEIIAQDIFLKYTQIN